jgi:protocatechuate 3,4-dioxygenase beta subunit
MRPATTLLIALAIAAAPALAGHAQAQVDPDWVRMWTEAQTHRPDALEPVGRLAPAAEPGTPLVIHGRVLDPDGKTPAAHVIVFAYQTDAAGVYSTPDKPGRPWRLQGWARTGADGRFEFRTIRPAPYPGRRTAAHVHVTVESDRFGRQYAPELEFDDDPLVTAEERRASRAAGLFGGVRPTRHDGGVQHVDYTVRLKKRADF